MKAHDIAFVRHETPGKLHHLSFLLDSWEKVLRAADLMSMNKVSIDIGPTRHVLHVALRFTPSILQAIVLKTFSECGYQSYPDFKPVKWTWDEVGTGIFYHDRKLNERFLSVVS